MPRGIRERDVFCAEEGCGEIIPAGSKIQQRFCDLHAKQRRLASTAAYHKRSGWGNHLVVKEETKAKLIDLQRSLGISSVDETILTLIKLAQA
jgi:hypothetical protein